jgi:hypothetical protein
MECLLETIEPSQANLKLGSSIIGSWLGAPAYLGLEPLSWVIVPPLIGFYFLDQIFFYLANQKKLT